MMSQKQPLKPILVLLYHRVIKETPTNDKHRIYILEKDFEQQLKYLQASNFQSFTFEDIIKRAHLASPKKAVVLTFDDGYTDNYEVAFPLLKKYNMVAAIYMVTAFNYNHWDAQHDVSIRFDLLTQAQMKEMASYGIEFGGHSHSHLNLRRLSDEQIKSEVELNKTAIESKIGQNVIGFAYPYGAVDRRVRNILAQSGYTYALSIKKGPLQFYKDFFQIRRIEVGKPEPLIKFKLKILLRWNLMRLLP